MHAEKAYHIVNTTDEGKLQSFERKLLFAPL